MSRSLSFWNRLLTSFGLIDDQKCGSRSNKRNKADFVRSRLLRTESLEHRTLLAVVPLYWNPQGASTDWTTSAANWVENYADINNPSADRVAWGDGTWGNGNDKMAVFANAYAKTAFVSGSVNVISMRFDVDGCGVGGSGSIIAQTANFNDLLVFVQSGCTAAVGCSIDDGTTANNIEKWDTGTLILSGNNIYSGSTIIRRGTLLATQPESLPGYDAGMVSVLDAGLGVRNSMYSGNTDPHSTLVVQAGNAGGWNAGEIDALIGTGGAVFEDNTNFGIQVAEGNEFDFGGHPFNAASGKVGFVKLGGGTLEFGSYGHIFHGPFSIYEGMLRAAEGQSTFSTSYDTSLFINDAAVLDLNVGNAYGGWTSTVSLVHELHGQPGAKITDHSIFVPLSSNVIGNAGLHIKSTYDVAGASVYSGSFKKGDGGCYPSLNVEFYDNSQCINTLMLNGNSIEGDEIELWAFRYRGKPGNDTKIEIGNWDNDPLKPCNMSVKNYMQLNGNFSWNSTGTLIVNELEPDFEVNEPHYGEIVQKSGIIRVTPSGETFARPSQALIPRVFYIDGYETAPAYYPKFQVMNSALLITHDYWGYGAMSVRYGDLTVVNSAVKIGAPDLSKVNFYEQRGRLCVEHGTFSIDDKSILQIYSAGANDDVHPSFNNLTLGDQGILETETPIVFKSYNYPSLGPGTPSDKSYFNASFIFNGGTLIVADAFPASQPVFVFQPDYPPDEQYPAQSEEYETPHLYIWEGGGNIATNNENAKITMPLEHDPNHDIDNEGEIYYEDGGLNINLDPDAEDEIIFSGSVTLCVNDTTYTEDPDDPDLEDKTLYTLYRGSTTIHNGELFIGDGTTHHNGPLKWIDDEDIVHYIDFQIEEDAFLVFYNHDDQQYNGVISGDGALTKSGSGNLTLGGSAANTYGGGTKLVAYWDPDEELWGKLILGKSGALGAAAGGLTVDSGVLDLNGFSIAVASLNGSGGIISDDSQTGQPATLTVNMSDENEYYGEFRDGIYKNWNLTLNGSYILTLVGLSGYNGNIALQNGATYQIGGTPSDAKVIGVTVVGVSGSFGSNLYTHGDTIQIAVHFDRPMLVDTAGLNLENMCYNAILPEAITSATIVLNYVVQWGDNIANLDYAAIDSLIVNCIYLDVPEPGSPYSLANSNVAVDTHLYWDLAGSQWDTTTENWHKGSPGGPTTNWVNGQDAVFWDYDNDAERYPALNNSVSANSITFKSGRYTLGFTSTNSITLAGGSTIRVDTDMAIIDCIINGSSGLIKNGDGILILSAVNAYTGDTVIDAGTLRLGGTEYNCGNGSVMGRIMNYSALIIDNSTENEITYGNEIRGSGSLTKQGSGTAYLTNDNPDFDGITIISAGALQLGNGGATGNLGGDIYIFDGATLAINHSEEFEYAGNIKGVGNLTMTGGGILDLNGNSTPMLNTIKLVDGIITNGTLWASFQYHLISGTISATMKDKGGVPESNNLTSILKDGSGTATISSNISMPCTKLQVSEGVLNVGNLSPSSLSYAYVANSGVLNSPSIQIPLYIGVAGPSATVNTTAVSNASYTVGDTIYIDITFDNPVAVTGAPRLQLAAGVECYAYYVSGSGTNTLTFAYTVDWNENAADLDYSGTDALDLNGGTIRDGFNNNVVLDLATPGEAHSLSANCDVAIDTRLYWDPAGVSGGDRIWDFGAADTYWRLGGPTGRLIAWVNGANVVFGACGDTPGAIYIDDYLDPNGPIVVRSITFLEDGYSLVGLTEDDTLSIAEDGTEIKVEGANNSATLACKLVDTALSDASLTKTGAGTLIFTNEEEYEGDTVIAEGTLQLGDGSTNGSVAGDIVNNAKLRFAAAVDQIFGGGISGGGAVEVENDASATLTLSGARTYTGGTTLLSGGLVVPGWTIIDSLADLQNIPSSATGNYLLVCDLDASATSTWNNGLGFAPIFQFGGHFDGGRHVISDLYIDRPDTDYVGLFNYTSASAQVHDLGLEDAYVFGRYVVGALVASNWGTMTNCYSTGTAEVTGNAGTSQSNPNCFGYVGGLAGWNYGTIAACHSSADVAVVVSPSDPSLGYGNAVGGLVGIAMASSTIRDSYSTGDVRGTGNIGGLVGWCLGDSITINNCYATGDVLGNWHVGGFVGYITGATQITDSFATGDVTGSSGWFVGQISGSGATFANNYYLERSGQPSPTVSGVSIATQAQLSDASFALYASGSTPWDFVNTWTMDDLPELRLVTGA